MTQGTNLEEVQTMKIMKYDTPSMEILSLENENIICASGIVSDGFTIQGDESAGSAEYNDDSYNNITN